MVACSYMNCVLTFTDESLPVFYLLSAYVLCLELVPRMLKMMMFIASGCTAYGVSSTISGTKQLAVFIFSDGIDSASNSL